MSAPGFERRGSCAAPGAPASKWSSQIRHNSRSPLIELGDGARDRARRPLQRRPQPVQCGPNAQPTSWDDTLAAIEHAELFWISTVRRDGRPHVTPLVAVWLDNALHFSTGPGEQKALNLAADPHVALTTGVNGWRSGLDVVVEGEAVRVTDDEQLHRLAAAWTKKWDGSWQYEVAEDGFRQDGEPVLVFAVRPAKVLAFGKGDFSHTSHRF